MTDEMFDKKEIQELTAALMAADKRAVKDTVRVVRALMACYQHIERYESELAEAIEQRDEAEAILLDGELDHLGDVAVLAVDNDGCEAIDRIRARKSKEEG